jgi:hypothetical protein
MKWNSLNTVRLRPISATVISAPAMARSALLEAKEPL